MSLFRIVFKVRPTPVHPKYREIAFGVLCVWVFAEGPTAADERARGIMAHLPFDVIGGMAWASEASAYPRSMKWAVELKKAEKSAEMLGVGFHLFGWPIGADDSVFLSCDPRQLDF
jgi:hypothetical protein